MKFFLRPIEEKLIKKAIVNNGQILVEVMIAISITVISLIGFFGLLKSSLNLTRITADNYIATHLAIEGIEIIANIMQENYINNITQGAAFNKNLAVGDHEIDFSTTQLNETTRILTHHPLKFDPDTKQYQYKRGNDTDFFRIVSISFEANKVHVVSTVYTNSVSGIPSAQVADTFQYWWRQ